MRESPRGAAVHLFHFLTLRKVLENMEEGFRLCDIIIGEKTRGKRDRLMADGWESPRGAEYTFSIFSHFGKCSKIWKKVFDSRRKARRRFSPGHDARGLAMCPGRESNPHVCEDWGF